MTVGIARKAAEHQQAMLAYVHVPKTGGTTLASFLNNIYRSDEIYRIHRNESSKQLRRFKAAMKKPDGLRLVHGHFDLSLSRWLPPDTRYFTVLRNPIERAISHYYHYRRVVNDPIHGLAMRSTLLEWISARGLKEMDNGQTRRLSGQLNVPIGDVGEETLEIAKRNLLRFAVVGLTERFQESQVLLHRAFHWPIYQWPPRNVDGNRAARAELDAATLRAIEKNNRYDIELYEFARKLFEDAVAGIDIHYELQSLKLAPVYEALEQKSVRAKPKQFQLGVLSRIRSILPFPD